MIEVAAAVIENREGRILIARRKAEISLGGYWEFPGGKIENGESPAVCAARELREEMLIPVAEFYSMNGIGDEVAQVYLALGVTLGEPQHESTEHIHLRLVPVEEGLAMAHSGAIKDGISALAILLSEPVLRQHLGERSP